MANRDVRRFELEKAMEDVPVDYAWGKLASDAAIESMKPLITTPDVRRDELEKAMEDVPMTVDWQRVGVEADYLAEQLRYAESCGLTLTKPLITTPTLPSPITPVDDVTIIQELLTEIQNRYSNTEIQSLACEIWKKKGCPYGQDVHTWAEAEAILKTIWEDEVVSKVAARHGKSPAHIKGLIVKKEKPKEKNKYTCWELVEEVVGVCDRVLLWGVSGTGKSWAARRNRLNGQPVFSVSLTDDTPAAELRGHYGIVDGSYKWLDGPCILSWRRGCRCVLNELEKASGDAQTFLLGFLDDIEIAQQTLPNNETLTPQKGFHVVATMNGKPDEDLLPALRDRFPVCINIDEVAPPAIAKLPKDIQSIAVNSGIIAAVQRRISIRVWNEFASLREKIGPSMAAACVFGDRAKIVLDHLKIKKASITP